MRQLIINADEIMMKSVNSRFIKRNNRKDFTLSTPYKSFKKTLFYLIRRPKEKIEAPYSVHVHIETYLDIDNPLKPILDSLKGIIINDDKNIEELCVFKKKRDRGIPSSLKVYVGSLKEPKIKDKKNDNRKTVQPIQNKVRSRKLQQR